jgi:hypothetical protein
VYNIAAIWFISAVWLALSWLIAFATNSGMVTVMVLPVLNAAMFMFAVAVVSVLSNIKRYLINYPHLFDYGQMIFLSFFSVIDRATAPGQYEQSYLNVKMLTKLVPYPQNQQ